MQRALLLAFALAAACHHTHPGGPGDGGAGLVDGGVDGVGLTDGGTGGADGAVTLAWLGG